MGICINGIRGRAVMVLNDIFFQAIVKNNKLFLPHMENISPGTWMLKSPRSSLQVSLKWYCINTTEFLFDDNFLLPLFLVEHLLYAKFIFLLIKYTCFGCRLKFFFYYLVLPSFYFIMHFYFLVMLTLENSFNQTYIFLKLYFLDDLFGDF